MGGVQIFSMRACVSAVQYPAAVIVLANVIVLIEITPSKERGPQRETQPFIDCGGM